jgi:hypothetical protein
VTRYTPHAPTHRTVERLNMEVDRLRAQLAGLQYEHGLLGDALIELTLRIDNQAAPTGGGHQHYNPDTREAHVTLDTVYGQDGW